MSFPFNSLAGPVTIDASLSGPLGQADVRLILDTGATTSPRVQVRLPRNHSTIISTVTDSWTSM